MVGVAFVTFFFWARERAWAVRFVGVPVLDDAFFWVIFFLVERFCVTFFLVVFFFVERFCVAFFFTVAFFAERLAAFFVAAGFAARFLLGAASFLVPRDDCAARFFGDFDAVRGLVSVAFASVLTSVELEASGAPDPNDSSPTSTR